MDIYTICKSLNLNGELKSYDVITAGNINTTYHVTTKGGKNTYEYLLQKINKNVFKDPVNVMKNIVNVSNYIANNIEHSDLKVLTFNTTDDGTPYLIDDAGNFWRSREYFDCITFNSTDNLQIIRSYLKVERNSCCCRVILLCRVIFEPMQSFQGIHLINYT
jgi:hypothetical protein